MSNIWLTSDLHFNHKMLILFKFRKFKNINYMNDFMVKNFYKINSHSQLYHLGDLAFGKDKLLWTTSLPGNTIYIKGNHDPQILSNIKSLVLTWRGVDFELVHDPNDASGKYRYIIHGHIHKTGIRSIKKKGKYIKNHIYKTNKNLYYNVNCEFHKYKPRLINEILGELNQIDL